MNLFVDRHLQNLSELNLGVIEMINFEPKYFVVIAFWVCQPPIGAAVSLLKLTADHSRRAVIISCKQP